MFKWFKQTGKDIDKAPFFTKQLIKDIIGLQFNPGKTLPTYSSAQWGISILTCCPKMAHEVKTIKDYEEARCMTAHTTQFNDVRHRQKTPASPPPYNYFERRLSVKTFCAFVWTLFGQECTRVSSRFVTHWINKKSTSSGTLSRPTCAAGLRGQSLATDAPFSTQCWLRHNFAGANISSGQHPSSTKLRTTSAFPNQSTAFSYLAEWLITTMNGQGTVGNNGGRGSYRGGNNQGANK
jgi:hypothetical protein